MKKMTRGKIIITLLLFTVLFCDMNSGHSAAAIAKIEASSKKRGAHSYEQIKSDLAAAVRNKNSAYLYLYSRRLEKSILEMDRIRKLAEKEGAGFFAIDIESSGYEAARVDFGVAYVPDVMHIQKGLGVVENFKGPQEVKDLKIGRKKYNLNKQQEKIAANTKKGIVTVLEFYAEWCNPCVEQAPVLDAVEKKYGDKLVVLRLHVEKETKLGALYNVTAPPAGIVIDSDGVPRLRFQRIYTPDDLINRIKMLGIKI